MKRAAEGICRSVQNKVLPQAAMDGFTAVAQTACPSRARFDPAMTIRR
jgi:hypothetical protein